MKKDASMEKIGPNSYNINNNKGYESSSTNHKVVGKSAQRLKDKLK